MPTKPINTGRYLLLATDIAGYGSGDAQRHRSIQRTLVDILHEAADAAVLHRKLWTTQPSGDGELAILPTSEPEHRLVDDFVRHLHRLLNQCNATRIEEARLRLRMAVHEGVVSQAANGFAGQAVVQVKRLLSCSALRQTLETSDTSLAVIVSDEIYDGTISQGYTTYHLDDFRRVQVLEKEYRGHAWVHVPRTFVQSKARPASLPDGVIPVTPVPANGNEGAS